MKIIVLLKQTPDTETVIKLDEAGKGIVTDNIKYVVNPYDEYAVEEALRVKEKVGGEVVIVSQGPDRCVEAIRTALAMGADRAVHLNDPAFEGSDPITVARMMATYLQKESFDLILCGRQAIDDDAWTTGPAVAELLDIPHISTVAEVTATQEGEPLTVTREAEGGNKEVIEVAPPVLLTMTKGVHEPRYASLPGIMKARKKPLETVDLSALGLPAEEVGEKGARMTVTGYTLPPPRKAGKILEGEPEEMAEELVRLLREEAKVI